MSFSAPTPPNPTTTAQTQQGFNTQAAETQQGLNMVSQSTPTGSLQYSVTGVDPITGAPTYGASTSLSPAEQALLQQQQGTQAGAGMVTRALLPDVLNSAGAGNITTGNILGAGATGADLLGSAANFYSTPPNLDPSTMTNTTLGMEEQYLNPWFNQQRGDLTATLANQGIAPGSEAYKQATAGLDEAQGGTIAKTFTSAEPLAFNQAVTSYGLPLATTGALGESLLGTETSALPTFMQGGQGALPWLAGYAAPQMPQFQQTPTVQEQPANYQGLTEQNYQQQMAQYQAMLSGLFGLAGNAARAGATVAAA